MVHRSAGVANTLLRNASDSRDPGGAMERGDGRPRVEPSAPDRFPVLAEEMLDLPSEEEEVRGTGARTQRLAAQPGQTAARQPLAAQYRLEIFDVLIEVARELETAQLGGSRRWTASRPIRRYGRLLRRAGGIATDDQRSISAEYWTATPVSSAAAFTAASARGQ